MVFNFESLSSLGSNGIDRLYAMAFDGNLHLISFNENNIEFSLEAQTRQKLDFSNGPAGIAVTNPYDNNLLIIIGPDCASVFILFQSSHSFTSFCLLIFF